jgi:hypothetical protein
VVNCKNKKGIDMTNLGLTLLITFITIALALLAMTIGYFAGNKVLKKQCGVDPNKKQDAECGKNPDCELCGGNKQKEKK